MRTLHYYDEIRLLTPSGRSDAGYRKYSPTDLARLRQILFYRELDFWLEQIAEILSDPDTGAEDHLRRQHRLLRGRLAHTERLLKAIETEMEARQMGSSLSPEEQLQLFGTDKLDKYLKEAKGAGATARRSTSHNDERPGTQRRTGKRSNARPTRTSPVCQRAEGRRIA